MNFVGRDAEIVGYGADEIDAALDRVLGAIDEVEVAVATCVVDGLFGGYEIREPVR